jgi:hypothetical protein
MISEGFYGTGESFLFTFYPDFRVSFSRVLSKQLVSFVFIPEEYNISL